MKMIKLTNAAQGFQGRLLYLNTLGGPGNSMWSVEESTSKIMALIQE